MHSIAQQILFFTALIALFALSTFFHARTEEDLLELSAQPKGVSPVSDDDAEPNTEATVESLTRDLSLYRRTQVYFSLGIATAITILLTEAFVSNHFLSQIN